MHSESLNKLESLTGQLTDRDVEFKKTTSTLNLALNLCNIGVWDLDIDRNILSWDKRMVNIFGKKISTYDDFLDCVHEDNRGAVARAVNTTIKKNVPYNIEYKINTPSGIKKIHARGKVVKDTAGVKRFIGVCVVLWECENE